jgi:hypothetical protein
MLVLLVVLTMLVMWVLLLLLVSLALLFAAGAAPPVVAPAPPAAAAGDGAAAATASAALAPQCQPPPGCRSCKLHAHYGAAERLCRVLRQLAPWYRRCRGGVVAHRTLSALATDCRLHTRCLD